MQKGWVFFFFYARLGSEKLESCLFEMLSRLVFNIRWQKSCFWNGILVPFMSVHILGCLFVWFAFQVCTLFWSWPVRWRAVQLCLPHGVEDGSVLHDAEQLVGGGHVVRNRPLAVAEKCVRRPDLADHQVVEPQDLDRTFELQPLVDPRLAEEHVHGVFLRRSLERRVSFLPLPFLLMQLLLALLSALPLERVTDGPMSPSVVGPAGVLVLSGGFFFIISFISPLYLDQSATSTSTKMRFTLELYKI